MPWDNTQPTDGTKVRLAPALIRTNWDALETGGVPFDALQLQEQAVDPVAAANTGFVYSKQSGTTTEAFYENDAGTVKQLTGLSVTTSTVTLPSGEGYTVNGFTTPWEIKINWGSGTLDGGVMNITWAVAFTNTPSITVSKLSTAVNNQPTVSNESNTGCRINGAATDGFSFQAIGV